MIKKLLIFVLIIACGLGIYWLFDHDGAINLIDKAQHIITRDKQTEIIIEPSDKASMEIDTTGTIQETGSIDSGIVQLEGPVLISEQEKDPEQEDNKTIPTPTPPKTTSKQTTTQKQQPTTTKATTSSSSETNVLKNLFE